MKKILSVLLASLILLLSGCGVSDQDIKESIPTLTLTSGEASFTIPAFSYSWTLTDRWGNGSSMAADPIVQYMSREQLEKSIQRTRKLMQEAAKKLDFIEAAQYRDEVLRLEDELRKKA